MNMAVSETDDLARLRGLPLFAGLGDDALRRIHGLSAEIDVPAGQTFVQAGDAASGMFVIEEGSVIVEARGHVEIELGPGEFVGELALLVPDSVRSARVQGGHRRPLPRHRCRRLHATARRRAPNRARDAPGRGRAALARPPALETHTSGRP